MIRRQHVMVAMVVWSVFAVILSDSSGIAAAKRPVSTELAGGPILTERGVGGLRLGRTLSEVRRAKLIGRVRPGCELVRPRPYWARLRSPLRGSATFTGSRGTSRLDALLITSGAVTDRGVRIGSTAAQVLRAYPEAKVQNSRPGDPLQFSAIQVTRGGRSRLWFMLDRPRGRVLSFEIPGPQFCE